jgi:UDP-glucose 4-epimerase
VRDYIHVGDLADAHLLALGRLRAGEVLGPLNLGTGRGHSVRTVLEAAGRVVGREVPHDIGARHEGDPARLVADPTRAGEVLGWTPKRSALETIVEDALRARR